MYVFFLQSVNHQNGVNVMSLKENVLEPEPSALVYKLPSAHFNGQNGLTGVSAHTTPPEIVYRQEKELLTVVKR